MSTLQAGFAKVKTTPYFPVGMSGYGCDATRLWEKIEEDLYLTCIAVKNEEKTICFGPAGLFSVYF